MSNFVENRSYSACVGRWFGGWVDVGVRVYTYIQWALGQGKEMIWRTDIYVGEEKTKKKKKNCILYNIYRYEGYPLVGPAHVFLGIKRKGELKQKQFMSVSTPPLHPRHRVRSLSPLLRSFVGYFSSFTTHPACSLDPLNPRKNVPWLLKVIRSCFYRTRRTGRARTLKQEPL